MIILAQSHCHCRRRHYSNRQCRRHHCGCRRRYCWCCDVVVVVVLRLLLLLLMQMMRCDWCYERPLFLIFVFLIVIRVVVDGVVAMVVIAIDVVVADVLVVGVVRDVVVDQNWHNPISVISGTFCSRIGCRIFFFFQYQNCVETPRRKFTTNPQCERKICFQIEQIFKWNFFLTLTLYKQQHC